MTLSEFQRKATMVLLFVAGATILIILGISLLTAPQPSTWAQFNLSVTGNQVLITHTGGESLDCELLAVLVNGEEISLSPGSPIECSWSIGETLTIPVQETKRSRSIRIIYNAGKGPYELLYAEIPGYTPEPETSGSPGPTSAIPLTIPTPAPTHTVTFAPDVPTASFNATQREGPVPLTVQFIDTSTGIPDRWSWSFGDGESSSLRNPRHTYIREGSYQVSLTAQNALGGHTRIRQGYITVTPSGEMDVVLEAPRGALLSPGGFLEFSVSSPGSWIKIGGQVINFPLGARIRLLIEDEGKGKISIRDGAILEFSFDRVVLFLDGREAARGAIKEITVRGYEDLVSSLDLQMGEGAGDVRILEGGVPISTEAEGAAISLASIRPDSSGLMTLECARPDSTFFQGAVTSYHIL